MHEFNWYMLGALTTLVVYLIVATTLFLSKRKENKELQEKLLKHREFNDLLSSLLIDRRNLVEVREGDNVKNKLLVYISDRKVQLAIGASVGPSRVGHSINWSLRITLMDGTVIAVKAKDIYLVQSDLQVPLPIPSKEKKEEKFSLSFLGKDVPFQTKVFSAISGIRKLI